MTIKLPGSAAEREKRASELIMPEVESRYGLLQTVLMFIKVIGTVVIILLAGLLLINGFSPTFQGLDANYHPIYGAPQPLSGIAQGIGVIIGWVIFNAFLQLIDMQISREREARLTNQLLFQLFRRRNSQ